MGAGFTHERKGDAMASLYIRHRVADYERWKRRYDDADWLRKKHGILFAAVARDPADPNVVMALHRFKNMKGAKEFSEEVRSIMREAGVQDTPEFWFGDDVEQTTYSS
jgi:hypothetical protein